MKTTDIEKLLSLLTYYTKIQKIQKKRLNFLNFIFNNYLLIERKRKEGKKIYTTSDIHDSKIRKFMNFLERSFFHRTFM